jgi:hypothetical protein
MKTECISKEVESDHYTRREGRERGKRGRRGGMLVWGD